LNAVHPQDPDRMVLAIEADGVSDRQSGSVRDRDRLWSTNWFYDAKDEVTELRDAYDRAVAAADEAAPPAAPPAPEPPQPEEPAAAPGQELDISGRPGPVTRSSP
jgi:hypothetical protein